MPFYLVRVFEMTYVVNYRKYPDRKKQNLVFRSPVIFKYARCNIMNRTRVFMAPVPSCNTVSGIPVYHGEHPVRSLAPLPYNTMPRNFLREITGNYFRNILLTIYGTRPCYVHREKGGGLIPILHRVSSLRIHPCSQFTLP